MQASAAQICAQENCFVRLLLLGGFHDSRTDPQGRLVVVGLLFLAGAYPLIMFFTQEPAVPMIMSIYVSLGVFLLLAAKNPAANRSLVAFAGWANVAHAGVMTVQEYLHAIKPQELGGVVVFGIVGLVLIVLVPAQPVREPAPAASD